MTQQEILEYQTMCALLLGWKETTDEFKIKWVGCKTKERLDKIDKKYIPFLEKDGNVIFHDFCAMDFTKDWNWIMEVVKAIEKLKYLVVIQSNFCQIQEIGTKENNFTPYIISSVYGVTKEEAVIYAINKFLIWYSNEKV